MAKQIKEKVEFLKQLRADTYLLGFRSPYLVQVAKPGQFVHIKIDEKITILRRPFSIHKISKGIIHILFRVRGRGTNLLSQYRQGGELDILGPLGNGFDYIQRATSSAQRILVAGGMGVAPLVFLGEKLKEIKNGKIPVYRPSASRLAFGSPRRTPRDEQAGRIKNTVILGAKNKNEVLAEQEFKRLGFEIRIATDDGSRGFKGTAPELLAKILSVQAPNSLSANIYACGPKEMFFNIAKIIRRYRHVHAQVSFEQFMGCGMGVCCGCAVETKNGYKKVCKDGPVFNLREI
ncbi:MAG: dihydroorotate dehydrogenase electron transfer subunit [Candidatus Omnitrophota bacterium]